MTVIVGLQMRSFQALQTLAATAPPQAALQTQEQQEKLRLQLLRETPSFGYNNLVADWAFLSFLQYFGDTDRRSQVGYGVSPEFFEVIVDKDPYFVTPYLFLSTSTSLFAGEPERTVEIMTRGTAAMTPEVPAGGYQVWRLRGIDQLLFLGDGAGAQQSFETAASWADQSSDPAAPSVAEASRQTAAFLAQNPVSKAAQISAWIQVSNLAVDERTQRLAVERIQALGGEILQLDQGRITVRYRSDE
ncbi:MAG: hypothetical protein ACFCVD_22655 [Nodosilinea sp.]